MRIEFGSELSRRQFVGLTLAGSALLLLPGRALAALSAPAKPNSFAALEPLPLGAVRPEGWLENYLRKQAAELGSQLPKVSWPFTEPFWKGDDRVQYWWPFEQVAYWIDGATRLAIVTGDQALMAQVRERIDYTLAHIDGDRFIGAPALKEPKEDFHRWPHTIFFRGLEALAEAGQAGTVAEAMRQHYLNDKADYGKSTRNVTNIESIVWCYEQTGDPALLALAEKAWADYLTVAADPEHGDLSADRVFGNAPIDAHGVTYMETAKQPAILYAATGKHAYLDFALAAQKRVFDHHMLIDGIPSTSEWYRGTTSRDMHETCCITDHAWSWSYLLATTGDGVWGDRVERALFNAGPGAIKNDWKAVQYFSCPNQFLATLDSDHGVMEHGGRMMAYQPNPGQRTACCGGNVHRLLPNYVARMWMRRGAGLAATLYGPSRVETTVGSANEKVTIVQTTDYPFEETIRLRLVLEKPTRFPLSLRIPGWCVNPHLLVNGKSVKAEVTNGFATLDREFHNGDTVTLTLPMRTTVSRWPQDGVGVERGPLVYALPIEADWKPVVETDFSTETFPSWNATPTSDWNYGLEPEPKIRFEKGKMDADPWSNPPVRLKVRARRLESWPLETDPKNPSQKYTPPLPEARKPEGKTETLTLVPYGSTHLRLTIFPLLPKS